MTPTAIINHAFINDGIHKGIIGMVVYYKA